MPRGEHRLDRQSARMPPGIASRSKIFNCIPAEEDGEYIEIPANEDDLTGWSLRGIDRTIQYGLIKDRNDPAEMDEELVFIGEQISDDAERRFGDLVD